MLSLQFITEMIEETYQKRSRKEGGLISQASLYSNSIQNGKGIDENNSLLFEVCFVLWPVMALDS